MDRYFWKLPWSITNCDWSISCSVVGRHIVMSFQLLVWIPGLAEDFVHFFQEAVGCWPGRLRQSHVSFHILLFCLFLVSVLFILFFYCSVHFVLSLPPQSFTSYLCIFILFKYLLISLLIFLVISSLYLPFSFSNSLILVYLTFFFSSVITFFT